MEELKQRLRAKRTKIKRYEQRIGLYRQNGLFTTEQKSLHRELSGEFGEDIIPDAEDSKKFWRDMECREGSKTRCRMVKPSETDCECQRAGKIDYNEGNGG